MPSQSVNFDRAAEYYDVTRGFPQGLDHDVAKFIADVGTLTTDSTVLEIGIGTGRIALPLSRHTGFYSGVDISRLMLQKLRAKHIDEMVAITQGDVLTLPFGANSFDAVIIVHVLHLVADGAQVLREVRRVLKPAGIVLKCQNSFGDSEDDPIKPIRDAWMHATASERRSRDRWYRVENMLSENGFEAIKPKQIYPYKSQTTPGHFLDRVEQRHWSNTWSMPDDVWQLGVNAIKEAITVHFNEDKDTLITQQSGFEVEVYA